MFTFFGEMSKYPAKVSDAYVEIVAPPVAPGLGDISPGCVVPLQPVGCPVNSEVCGAHRAEKTTQLGFCLSNAMHMHWTEYKIT